MNYCHRNSLKPAADFLRIGLAFFLLGAFSVNLQSILLREFMVVFYGNELSSGLLLGWLLFAIGLGSWLYRRFFSPPGNSKVLFGTLLWLLSLLSPLQLLILRDARRLLNAQVGVFLPLGAMFWFSGLVVLPLGCLIGLLFPLGLSCLRQKNGVELARIYVWEALGFLAGGILFSFYLAGRFSSFQILGWLGLGLMAAGILFFQAGKLATRRTLAMILGVGILAGWLIPAMNRLETFSLQTRWKGLNPALPLLKNLDTRYQNLALTRQRDLYSVFDNGSYDFSFPDPYQEETLAALICTQHPNPENLLLVGDASPTLLKTLLEFPLKRVDWVLLDPGLPGLIEESLSPRDRAVLKNPRLKVFYRDARVWFKENRTAYDLIFLETPDPTTALLNRFYTRDFFQICHRALRAQGVMALSVSAGENYLGNETVNLAGSVYHTLRSVFPFIALSPGDKNFFFAGKSRGSCSENPRILISRLKKSGVKFSHFSSLYLETFYYPERIQFTKSRYEAQKNPMLNTDLRPVSYFYALELWLRQSGGPAYRLFLSLEKIGFIGWAGIIIALGLWAGFLTRHHLSPARLDDFNQLYAIASAGFSSLSFSLLLMFALQNYYGFLYQMVGMLLAVFMLGSALGGALCRLLMEKKTPGLKVIQLQAAWAVFSFCLPWILPLSRNFATPWLILLLGGLNGILGGLTMPLAAKQLMKNRTSEKAAGSANAADHWGGALGALFFGILFIPWLGIAKACYLLGLSHLVGIGLRLNKKSPADSGL